MLPHRGDHLQERVGTADRGRALELLSRALDEGYLDLHDYEQRTAVAVSARTVGELAQQLADLPAPLQWQASRYPPAYPGPAGSPPRTEAERRAHAAAVASLVLGIASVPLAVCLGVGALFGVAAMLLSRPGLATGTDYGKALAGLVVGAIGTFLSVGMVLLYILVG